MTDIAEFDDNDHAIYKREAQGAFVNPYNAYLLSLFECNMDIQMNKGPGALHYLAKYLTILDDDVSFDLKPIGKEITEEEHFKSRIVGSIEAPYNLLELQSHGSSREVYFIPMNLPHDNSRGIRNDIRRDDIQPSDENIFKDNNVQQYEKRKGIETKNLLLTDFVMLYYKCSTAKEKNHHRSLATSLKKIDEYPTELPQGIISGDVVFRLRDNGRRFWRTCLVTAMADSGTYYYQQILLNIPEEYKNKTMMPSLHECVISWR